MAKTEPKNERVLCDAVANFLAKRRAEAISKVEPVDAVVRNRPAVEFIYHTDTAKFAIEHTRIESFPNQIGEGKRFVQIVEPLEAELAGKLPGVFFLTIGVGAARVPAAEQESVRAALTRWILDSAARLEPEEKTWPRGNCALTATPPGVPFQATLTRDCDYDSRLFAFQGLVGDLQQLRRQAIARSLAKKCPKLEQASADGCISVLILELDDPWLGDQVVASDATVAELAARSDQPAIVVWARTSTRPWKGALIKDDGDMYPDVDSRLFPLEM